MPQEDFEDLNVMNLAETKSQRAPTFESIPYSAPQPTRINWLKTAAALGVVAGLIAVTLWVLIPRQAS